MPRFKHQTPKKQPFVSAASARAWWSDLELAMLAAACGAEVDEQVKQQYPHYRWPARRCSPQRIQTMFPNRSWTAIKFQCRKYGWYPGPEPKTGLLTI
jgi:hypothetical protein